MAKAYNSFKEFFESGKLEIRREVESMAHSDENIANNRLFVWNFEEADLEEFLEYFQIYKENSINAASRQKLSGSLMRKMNEMVREGYNPVECMLYASKTVNMKLQNDKELQNILAERIKDVYLRQESETEAVLNNIIKMWTWVPQVRVVITAVGFIGDNQELLDSIMLNYAEDPSYRSKVFYALMFNKSLSNLERVLKIIMNLQDCEEDTVIGRTFAKEISGFGYEGNRLVSKYYGNPGISKAGAKVLRKIKLQDNTITSNEQDEDFYRRNLANKSARDDLAYKDFLEDCWEKYDDSAFYLSRFSRQEIGSFLKSAIEDDSVSSRSRGTAIISLGIIGAKGYTPAAGVLKACGHQEENGNAVLVARILLNEEEAAVQLADIFCKKKDYELSELYSVLKSANIVSYNYVVNLVAPVLEKKFRELLESDAYDQYERLDCLTSNFQMFWNKNLYRLLSKGVLDTMRDMLTVYAQNTVDVPADIIVSVIETVVHSWNAGVEKAVFALYKQSDNQRIQEISFKKLKERQIEAPK